MRAKGVLAYLGGLVIGQGRHAGEPFLVLPWQWWGPLPLIRVG